MVQSINTKALLTLASVVRRPSLLVPHATVDTISHISYQTLKDQCGIQAVIFDKDNTITAPYALETHEKAHYGLQQAVQVFGTDNVAIVSNSAGTLDDADYQDALQIEQSLGIAVIRHDEKKPGGLQEVLNHFNHKKHDNSNSTSETTSQQLTPSQLCMVGDRLLTDIVFGNLHGMLTIHCLPLCSGAENQHDNTVAKIVRTGENAFLYKNWFGGRYLLHKKRPSHAVWDGHCQLTLEDSEIPIPNTKDKDTQESQKEAEL